MILPILNKYKNYFQGFFYTKYVLKFINNNPKTLFLELSVYSWFLQKEKPECLTPLITGAPFLHAYSKIFSQLFIDDSSKLIGLYTKNKFIALSLFSFSKKIGVV